MIKSVFVWKNSKKYFFKKKNFIWRRSLKVLTPMLKCKYKIYSGKVPNTLFVKDFTFLNKTFGSYTFTKKEFFHRRSKDKKKREREEKLRLKNLEKMKREENRKKKFKRT